MFGGFTPVWGSASFWGNLFASNITYGTLTTGHTRDDMLNSRLIIMWGWNPAESIQSTNTSFFLAKAKEAGIPIVSVDPRFTDSAAAFAHEWIPIRPGTDTAMLIAMAQVIISTHLQDQHFIDTYTLGFNQFKDYVMGIDDGIPKTPLWAEAITGVPAATIEALAKNYASLKPAALLTLGAPGVLPSVNSFTVQLLPCQQLPAISASTEENLQDLDFHPWDYSPSLPQAYSRMPSPATCPKGSLAKKGYNHEGMGCHFEREKQVVMKMTSGCSTLPMAIPLTSS